MEPNQQHTLCKLRFNQIVIAFIILAFIEIILRYFWNDITPLSFVFPVFLLLLLFQWRQDKLNLTKTLMLTVPLLLIIPLFILILHTKPNNEIWRLAFYIIMFLFVEVYSFYTLIITVQLDNHNFESQKAQTILIISIVFIFTTLITAFQGLNNYWESGNMVLKVAEIPLLENFIRFIPHLFTIIVLLYYLYENRKRVQLNWTMDNINEIEDVLFTLFKNEEVYLQPDLTLKSLEDMSGIEKVHFEHYFNFYLQKEFHFFVAEYRIAHAISLIREQGKTMTIEGLAYECGYRSKTSFYKYFKQLTGKKPSDLLNNNTIQD